MASATDSKLENLAINSIRMLAVDAIQKANSGHPGLPMGAASMGYVLWTEFLKHNPSDPHWQDRDRFVLSAGHGSMLLYALLYLTGYDVTLDDLKSFRQLGSRTPGHPERGHTPGVEVTTGPLGQGFGNGVGLAMAEAHLAARFNRPGHEIVNHYTYGIVSDGDVMEGVSMESASLAGHLGLGKLIYLYDQNHITLAGTANVSFTEDVETRFKATGWHTVSIDGMDTQAIRDALNEARSETNKPSLILARTHIGFGSPKKQDTSGVHGSPLGAEETQATKQHLGWPLEPDFYVPDEALKLYRSALDRGSEEEAAWRMRWDAYADAYPDLAAELSRDIAGELPDNWDASLPTWKVGDKAIATRKASEAVIQAFAPIVTNFIGGSADLDPSTNTAIKGAGDFASPSQHFDDMLAQGSAGGGFSYAGRNIHFGIREHGMGASVNGMAAHGGLLPFGATFLVFSDYMRASVRLSALSKLHSIWVYTHDSIAVGEDGPTHEPVEQVMSLRLIPQLTVIRPADANETATAWRLALAHGAGPTALILTRQDLPVLDQSQAFGDASKGGYLLAGDEDAAVTMIATGSEVSLAVDARAALAEHGIASRVASLPSWEVFAQQDASYREKVLGPESTPRLSIEAGVTTGWQKFTGSNGRNVGIDQYGASGPGNKVLAHFGFTKEHVTAEALRLLGKEALAAEIEPEHEGGQTAGKAAKGADGHS